MNRRGPRTEPWGKPLQSGEEPDLRSLSWTNCVRPERYYLNQARGMSVIPMEANLSRRMSWEMPSKAVLRSRRTRMERSPESDAIRRSFVIFTRAVSVLSSTDRNQTEIVHRDCCQTDGCGPELQQFFLVFWREMASLRCDRSCSSHSDRCQVSWVLVLLQQSLVMMEQHQKSVRNEWMMSVINTDRAGRQIFR